MPVPERRITRRAILFALSLRNTHAMENQSQELMDCQAERLAEFPEVHSTVNEHLEERRAQLRRLEDCLEALVHRTFKDTAIIGQYRGHSQAAARGEVLRNPALREHLGSQRTRTLPDELAARGLDRSSCNL